MATVFAMTSSGHASSSSPSLSATAVIPVANGDDHAANQGSQDDTAVVQSRKKSSTSSSKIKSSRRHKFHKTFPHFAHDEVLLNAFSCAFFGDILLQGHLYVSTRMFSFYCRILGQEKRIEIPMKDVLRITREKTAIFIPNAIGILTADNKYTFGSLLQRNVTYNLMVAIWKANQAELADSVLLPIQDTSSKLDETESVSLSLAKASSDRDDNDASIDSDVSSSSRLTEPFLEAEDNSVSSTSNTGVHGDQSTLRLSAPPPKKASTSSSSTFMYLTLPCLPLVKALYIANRMLAKMHSLPRTNVMLLLLLVIVSFLMFITMLLTYKVIALQAQLSGNCAAARTGPVAAAVYDLRQATHDTSVDRIHAIMESTALLLNEIHGSLESLRRPFVREKS